jgi:hypothetical protein
MRRVLMARRGRKRRLAGESPYWRLILSGVGTLAACEEVGIGRKTGYRWWAENGGLPPDRLAEGRRSGRAAIATPGLDRDRIDVRVRELRVLVGRRANLVKRRAMAINHLKAQAHPWT